MKLRDRIKSLRRVKASDLRPNPRNWRVHPQIQQDALRSVLADVGIVDAVLARELPDGTLELIDGHLRAETVADEKIPVLVLDVTAEEADKILATFDPLGELAETNQQALAALLDDVAIPDDAFAGVLAEMAGLLEEVATTNGATGAGDDTPPNERWAVIVECRDEAQQLELLERLSAEGFDCKGVAA